MKYLVVSDIHGVSKYLDKLEEIIEREEPDKIILLGDLFYHGFTKEYQHLTPGRFLLGVILTHTPPESCPRYVQTLRRFLCRNVTLTALGSQNRKLLRRVQARSAKLYAAILRCFDAFRLMIMGVLALVVE